MKDSMLTGRFVLIFASHKTITSQTGPAECRRWAYLSQK